MNPLTKRESTQLEIADRGPITEYWEDWRGAVTPAKLNIPAGMVIEVIAIGPGSDLDMVAITRTGKRPILVSVDCPAIGPFTGDMYVTSVRPVPPVAPLPSLPKFSLELMLYPDARLLPPPVRAPRIVNEQLIGAAGVSIPLTGVETLVDIVTAFGANYARIEIAVAGNPIQWRVQGFKLRSSSALHPYHLWPAPGATTASTVAAGASDFCVIENEDFDFYALYGTATTANTVHRTSDVQDKE